ncbi:MAG: M14 family metallopeptidase [Candidatus Lernaella stagnicola]|nr:M14 family metallopeptidase [Candidatus Lernaella stagnicola]
MKRAIVLLTLSLLLLGTTVATAQDFFAEREFVRINTRDVTERDIVADMGFAIDYVNLEAGWVAAWVPKKQIPQIERLGIIVEPLESKDTMPPNYGPYHDYQEQVEAVQEMAATYPEITDLYTIGQSIGGQDLWCLKISDNPLQDELDESAIIVVALHHAREILTPEMALYAAQQLVEGYGVDEEITYYVENREIFVIPTLNPDGGEYDHATGNFRMWRKNRRVNEGSSCRGVDLNRNYGYLWGGVGSSASPCADTYRGAEAFSEPESRALRDFTRAHENVRTLLTLHTHAKLVLYPWGNQSQHIDDQIDFLTHKTMAEYMASILKYSPGQASSLYRTTGDTTDWSYGELGIVSFTWEMAPSQYDITGFYPPPSIMETELPRGWNALRIMLNYTREPSLILATDPWKLTAEATEDAVTVEWATLVETNAKGYKLLRADEGSGNFEPLHDGLIQTDKGDYLFVDENVEPGASYEYLLTFKGTNNNDVEFDPIAVTIPGSTDDDVSDDDAIDDDTAADDDTAGDDDAAGNDDADADDDDDDDDDGGCGC